MSSKYTISIMGCGWLGLPLGIYLAAQGHRVKGSTTSKSKLAKIAEAGIEPHLIEVGESLDIEEDSDFFDSDLLILNIPPGRRREGVEIKYPQEMETVLWAAVEGGIRKMIFVSSTSVYGELTGEVTEATEPLPSTSSGRGLTIAENLLLDEDEIALTILRFAGLAGGDRKAGRFLAGKQNLPNGLAPVNLVHRDDCIRIIAAIIQQEKWGEIYQVAADEHPPKVQFYPFMAKKMGIEPPSFQMNGEDGKVVSNAKVKRDLKYTFLHPDPMLFS
ncbi:MAG: NAD(P)-dependent oxidoreductase [Saprospiraceae bacterium]|nr:MAG: NAD(P)-dependent oxidoreductase [Saprospiraceae bacterium]